MTRRISTSSTKCPDAAQRGLRIAAARRQACGAWTGRILSPRARRARAHQPRPPKLGSRECHRPGVLGPASLIPVAGAVDRRLRDPTIAHSRAKHFARVPALALCVRPALLELEDEAVWSGIGAPAADAALVRMALATQANHRVNALGLQPPLRQAEVAKDVGMKQVAAWEQILDGRLQPIGGYSPGARVLCGVARPQQRAHVTPGLVEQLVGQIAERYEHVLLDLGDEPLSGSAQESMVAAAALGTAGHVLLVAAADPLSVHRAQLAREDAASLLEPKTTSLVINRCDSSQDAASSAAALRLPLVGVIPTEPYARQALADGQPAVCNVRLRIRRPIAQLASESRRRHLTSQRFRMSASLVLASKLTVS